MRASIRSLKRRVLSTNKHISIKPYTQGQLMNCGFDLSKESYAQRHLEKELSKQNKAEQNGLASNVKQQE